MKNVIEVRPYVEPATKSDHPHSKVEQEGKPAPGTSNKRPTLKLAPTTCASDPEKENRPALALKIIIPSVDVGHKRLNTPQPSPIPLPVKKRKVSNKKKSVCWAQTTSLETVIGHACPFVNRKTCWSCQDNQELIICGTQSSSVHGTAHEDVECKHNPACSSPRSPRCSVSLGDELGEDTRFNKMPVVVS